MNSEKEQEFLLLLSRGDIGYQAMVALRDTLTKQIATIDTILEVMDKVQSGLQGVPANSKPQQRIINVIRMQFPEKTEGLTDEEVLKLMGDLQNGTQRN